MKENKLKNAMRFYLLATQLKYKIRSGWDEKHWNVSKERIESIAEHVYGTCFKRRFSYVDRMQTDFQGKPNSVCC